MLISSATGSAPYATHPALADIATLTPLASADVAFAGRGPGDAPIMVGVELKKLPDLLACLHDKRLTATNGQLRTMLDAYDEVWLVVEGLARVNPETGALQTARCWPQKHHPTRVTVEWHDYAWGGRGGRAVRYDFVEALLASPAFTSAGVRVMRTPDADTTAAWLRVLYRAWQKPYADHTALATGFDESGKAGVEAAVARWQREGKLSINPIERDKFERRALTAFAWPLVGYDRAMAVAAHFKSVRAMVEASEKDWRAVPGVGRVVAKAVYAAINEEASE